GVPIVVGGGVRASARPTSRSLLSLDDTGLTALRDRSLDASQSGNVSVRVPGLTAEVVPPDTTRVDRVEVTIATALRRLSAGDIDGAARAIAESPNDSDPELIALRSITEFASLNFDAAAADATLAQRLDPDIPLVSNLATVVLFKIDILSGLPREALSRAEWGIARNPESTYLRLMRSEALLELRRFDDARTELTAVLRLDPTSPLALARLGMLEVSEGWFTTGRRLIGRAASMSGALAQDGPEIKVARALGEAAAAFYGNAARQFSEAGRLAEEVLNDPACDPRSAVRALTVLAGSAAFQADWALAERHVNRARELAPGSPEVLTAVGQIAHQAKRDDIARKYLNEVRVTAPDHPAVIALVEALKNGGK
ncbi:MAG: tetratricopeptide repeat protein, partial [Vicinamibacterales bacterium]